MSKIAAFRSLTALATLIALAPIATATHVLAQQSYKTPQAAAEALAAAAKSSSEKGALAVLGRDGKDIVSSGDKVADKTAREKL